MRTESLVIDDRFGEEYQGTYQIRQVTQGEYECVLLQFMDRAGRISRESLLKVNRQMLWKSLVNQPTAKPLTLDVVLKGNMPHGLAAKLQEAYDKVNGIQADERDFLSPQSEDGCQTRDSPNSSCATDSAGPQESTEEQTARRS